MKLFLASEAKHPDSFPKLTEYVGGDWKNKRIVYVPTAANGETGYGSWNESGSLALVRSLGADVRVVELEEMLQRDIFPDFEWAEVIWMAGGWVSYLLYWLHRSGLSKKLPELLSDNSRIYVGSSAGCMVLAPTTASCSWYIGEADEVLREWPSGGVGLIPFEFYPHYAAEMRLKIEEKWQTGELYLLKDGDALIIEDDTVTEIGSPELLKK
jgi:peptidase E